MNVPRLRFKELSGEWEVKKVGVICDFIVPGRNKPTEFEGDIPWITTPDIEQNGIVLYSKKNLNITREEAKNIGSKIVPKNSIIISCVGELGLVAISGTDLIINQQLHAFIPKENIYFRFLLYALTIQKPYMEKIATKTAVPYMNKDNCNSIPVIMPSLPEQTKIANFLTAVDKKIAQLTQKDDLLARYKTGVMQQIFCQQLRFKDGDGQEFPEWKEKELGKVTDIIMGQSPDSKSYNDTAEGKPLIQGNADISNRKTSPRIWTSEPTKECKTNDIILTVRAPVGAVAKSYHNACIGRGVCAMRSNYKSIVDFIYQLLLWFEPTKWVSLEQGSTFTAVNSNDIKTLIIPVPCIEEQTKIANFLTALDDKISHNQTQLNALKQYKQGLLQQMFV
jgi:type I restriction enzyme, S subunit